MNWFTKETQFSKELSEASKVKFGFGQSHKNRKLVIDTRRLTKLVIYIFI